MTLTFHSPMPDAAAAFAAIELIQAIHRKGGDGFCNGCDYGWPCQTIEAINAVRGGKPSPDSQRFRYGNGNNIPTAENTILDDSDDEKVVADNYVDNVTDAGDTPQPATTWVRPPLQTADVDTSLNNLNEPINDVVRTVSPASTLQNRQDEERFVSLRICGPRDIDETAPGPSESDYIVANIARILNEFPKTRSTLSVQVLIKQIRDAIGDR